MGKKLAIENIDLTRNVQAKEQNIKQKKNYISLYYISAATARAFPDPFTTNSFPI